MSHAAPQSTPLESVVELIAEHGFDDIAKALELLFNEVMKLERAQFLQARNLDYVKAAKAMGDVVLALMPATLAGLWFFGLGALLVLLACIAGAMLTEWVFSAPEERRTKMLDGSGLLTGLLLGLTLPPGLALWMVALGGLVGVGVGKFLFGGLGYNAFNPALVGRAFLYFAYPVQLSGDSVWTPIDGFSGATALGAPPSTRSPATMQSRSSPPMT